MKLSVFKTMPLVVFVILFNSCKKEKPQTSESLGPIKNLASWELAAKSTNYRIYSNGVTRLHEVREHSSGIDVAYSSVFQFQFELDYIGKRWRAYKGGNELHEDVVLHEIANKDPLGRPILSNVIDVYSKGMGNSDLLVLGSYDVRGHTETDPAYNEYKYFEAKKEKSLLFTFPFRFKSTQVPIGYGSINSSDVTVCNGLNFRSMNNALNHYNFDGINFVTAAKKNNQYVLLGFSDTMIYICETNSHTFVHSSGSYSENLQGVVVKNMFNLYKITGSRTENFIDQFFVSINGDKINLFIKMRNMKHRYLSFDIDDFTMKTYASTYFEQIANPLYNNGYVLMTDQPGELVSVESSGVYKVSALGRQTIAMPEVEAGTIQSNYIYRDGKLWNIVFGSDASYLIFKNL